MGVPTHLPMGVPMYMQPVIGYDPCNTGSTETSK